MYLTEILFLWQTQIQIVKYGLNDKGIEKSYIDTLLIQTLWYEFSNVFVAHSDFGKIFVTILILSILWKEKVSKQLGL